MKLIDLVMSRLKRALTDLQVQNPHITQHLVILQGYN